MKVEVYCNVRTKRLSIRAVEGRFNGLVIATCDQVELEDAKFKVSQAGRQRCLMEGRKNVHATVVGELCAVKGVKLRSDLMGDEQRAFISAARSVMLFDARNQAAHKVSYNPYKGPQFVAHQKDGSFVDIVSAQRVNLNQCQCAAVGVTPIPVILEERKAA